MRGRAQAADATLVLRQQVTRACTSAGTRAGRRAVTGCLLQGAIRPRSFYGCLLAQEDDFEQRVS